VGAPFGEGSRLRALEEGCGTSFRDVAGDPVAASPEINTALARAVRAERVVVDAHLTHQPIQAIAEVAARDSRGTEVPTATAVVGQWWFGSLLRGRRRKVPLDPETVVRDPLPADADIAIVVVDLLSLDDQPLLDVPLLERKRILESVIVESEFVRRGI